MSAQGASGDLHETPPTGIAGPDPAQDLRGWFYRAFAPDARCAVLEVGEANAGAWFANVTRGDLGGTRAIAGKARFDMIFVHRTLGGCATLAAAAEAAQRLLRPGGSLVLFGVNRLRPGERRAALRDVPRATGWGFRKALARAGFADIGLYLAHPPRDDAIYMIDARSRSARAFFRSELAGRELPALSPRRTLFALLVRTGLMTYLQPGFIVVGRKC